MRLIDADELRKAFKKSLFVTDVSLHYAREIIDNAPTIEERPTGEWIEKEEPFGWSDIKVAYCSVCNHSWALGELSIEEVKEDFKFCPNCGARMEGEG